MLCKVAESLHRVVCMCVSEVVLSNKDICISALCMLHCPDKDRDTTIKFVGSRVDVNCKLPL